jgi:hypothetical protein
MADSLQEKADSEQRLASPDSTVRAEPTGASRRLFDRRCTAGVTRRLKTDGMM